MIEATANEMDATDPVQIASRADELLARNRTSLARGLLGPALEQHPDHPDLLYQLARADLMDQKPGVPEALHQLLRIDPGHRGGRLQMFYVELAANRLREAEEIVLKLLQEAPQQPVYYAAYSRLMLRALDFRKADRLANEALRFGPTHDYCLQTKILCDLAAGRRSQDSAAFTRLLVEHPDDSRTLRLVVVALVHAKRMREALRLSQELLRAHPNDQSLLKLVVTLKQSVHWTLLPLWPMRKFGWAGSAGLWMIVVVSLSSLRSRAPEWAGPFAYFWIGFVIYSWVWPRVLRQWLQRDLQ